MGAHLSTKIVEGHVFMHLVEGNHFESFLTKNVDVFCTSWMAN
jgi:hypothetical protein